MRQNHPHTFLFQILFLVLTAGLLGLFMIYSSKPAHWGGNIAGSSFGNRYLSGAEKKDFLKRLSDPSTLATRLIDESNIRMLRDTVLINPDTIIGVNERDQLSSILTPPIEIDPENQIITDPIIAQREQAETLSREIYLQNYDQFGIEPNVADNLYFTSSTYKDTYFSVAQQTFMRLPVTGGYATTSVTNTKALIGVSANLYNIPSDTSIIPAISREQAFSWVISHEHLNAGQIQLQPGAELVILPYKHPQTNDLRYVLTWKMELNRTDILENYMVWIDAGDIHGVVCVDKEGQSTRECARRNLVAEGKVEGSIDRQQPQTVGFPFLAIPGNGKSDATGNFPGTANVSNLVLSGDAVNVFRRQVGGARGNYTGPGSVINLDNAMDLDERTAYASIALVRDYWERQQGLNFGNAGAVFAIVQSAEVNNDPQVNGCNAFYRFGQNTIQFGSTCASGQLGGNNLGEFRSIASHEYGHAITEYVPNYNWIPSGTGTAFEIAANEGFADYIACTVTGNSVIPLVGRNCSNTYTLQNITTRCPQESYGPEVHCAGMVLSGSLWDARQKLGAETLDRIIAEAQNRGGTLESYSAFLSDLLKADDTDNNINNGTPHCGSITSAFGAHGITFPGLSCVDSGGNPGNANQNQSPLPKSIEFGAVPTSGTAPLNVTLSITLKNFNICPTPFTVEFGDGKNGLLGQDCAGGNPVVAQQTFEARHTYDQSGTFQAKAKVETFESSSIPIVVSRNNANENSNENQNGNINTNSPLNGNLNSTNGNANNVNQNNSTNSSPNVNLNGPAGNVNNNATSQNNNINSANAATLSGTVRCNNNPAANVQVRIVKNDRNYGPVSTGSDGNYVVTNIETGSGYTVMVSNVQSPCQNDPAVTTALTINSGNTTFNIDLKSCTNDEQCRPAGNGPFCSGTSETVSWQCNQGQCVYQTNANSTNCTDSVCQNMQCVSRPGNGNRQCQSDQNCTDKVCDATTKSCKSVPGSGRVECAADTDCQNQIRNLYIFTNPFNGLMIGYTVENNIVNLTAQGSENPSAYTWSLRGNAGGELSSNTGTTNAYRAGTIEGEDVVTLSDGQHSAYARIKISLQNDQPSFEITTTNLVQNQGAFPLNVTLGSEINQSIAFKALAEVEDQVTSQIRFNDVTASVNWKSSDSDIGSIDDTGLFMGKTSGTTRISATYQAQTANTVTLEVLPSFLEVNPDSYMARFNPNPVARGYSTRFWVFVDNGQTNANRSPTVSVDLSALNITPECAQSNSNISECDSIWHLIPAESEGTGRWYYNQFRIPFTVVPDTYPIRVQASMDDGSIDRTVTIPLRVADEVVEGDINGDGSTGIADVIFALRILAGSLSPNSGQVNFSADINGDGFGFPEVISLLSKLTQ